MPNPRKPAALKALEGGRGNRPVTPEVEIEETLVMPATLSKEAKVVWLNVVGSMPEGVYKLTDAGTLAAYCEQLATHERACAKIAEEGEVSEGSQGQLVVSPWVRLRNDAARLMVTLGSKLGLNPTDRANLSTTEKKGTNPFLR